MQKSNIMEVSSYNETRHKQLELRHIFFPSIYGFVSETVVAVVALVLFNVSQLSSQLLTKSFGTADPLSLWSQNFGQVLNDAERPHVVQQIFLFVLWAIVGALIYILIFRLIQVIFRVKQSVDSGVMYVRNDHAEGVLHWLASLHDFFLKAVLILLGTAALVVGAIVCFGIASQELSNGLLMAFPGSAGALFISLVAAVLSVRMVVLGFSLLFRRFRIWYND